jgi:putative tryptophan/tyrosine transport system substrate-binding protein
MINKIKFLFFIMILLFFTGIINKSNADIIMIVKDKDIPPYAKVIKGLRNILNKKNDIKINVVNLNDTNIVKEISIEKPKIICTIGARATKTVKQETQNIPIVFSMMLENRAEYFNNPNITGVSLSIPAKIQFQKLKEIYPNVKNIGVIYNPTENAFVVSQALIAAKEENITLKLFPMNNTENIPLLNEMGIDALWLIPDTIICQQSIIKHLLLMAIKNKIVVMGFSPAYVKAGACIALSYNYEDIGEQSAEIIKKILNGISPSEIPIDNPRDIKIYVNKDIMKMFNLNIPDYVSYDIEEVSEE